MDRYKFPEKHGLWKDHKREHQCWQDMIQRCTNEKHRAYKNYGARGISICDEWLNDFANFFNDMGIKPPGFSLDRIDNNKEYSKQNCRWASISEQQRNRRSCVFIEYQGQSKTIVEWAEETGVESQSIRYRYLRGYPLDMVFSKEKFNKYSLKEKNGQTR